MSSSTPRIHRAVLGLALAAALTAPFVARAQAPAGAGAIKIAPTRRPRPARLSVIPAPSFNRPLGLQARQSFNNPPLWSLVIKNVVFGGTSISLTCWISQRPPARGKWEQDNEG